MRWGGGGGESSRSLTLTQGWVGGPQVAQQQVAWQQVTWGTSWCVLGVRWGGGEGIFLHPDTPGFRKEGFGIWRKRFERSLSAFERQLRSENVRKVVRATA